MDGEYEAALLHYLQSAEMGSEIGQSNAAWMLTHGYGYQGEAAAQLAIKLDAFVPVFLALCGLWLHSWWLSVKPYVPDRFIFLKQRMFELHEAEQGAVQEFGGDISLWQHFFHGMHRGIDVILDMVARIGSLASIVTDQAELFLLVGCGAGLWLVLQRRRRLRMIQQAQPHEPLRTQTDVPNQNEHR